MIPGWHHRQSLRAARLWRDNQTFWVELLPGLVTAGWGAHLVLMSADLADLPGYRTAARWAPDEVWATLAVLGGAGQAAAALLQVGRARKVFGLAMAAFWLLLADGVRQAPVAAPGLPLYLGMALFALVAALRNPWGIRP